MQDIIEKRGRRMRPLLTFYKDNKTICNRKISRKESFLQGQVFRLSILIYRQEEI